MVCLNKMPRFQINLIERAKILKLPIERALFLASCPHSSVSGNVEIPYIEVSQIKEAYRLGIGLSDTAKMMEMTHSKVLSYGFPFKKKSKLPHPPGFGGYNLLTQDQYIKHNTKRKTKQQKIYGI